jgi:hypothetical protein
MNYERRGSLYAAPVVMEVVTICRQIGISWKNSSIVSSIHGRWIYSSRKQLSKLQLRNNGVVIPLKNKFPYFRRRMMENTILITIKISEEEAKALVILAEQKRRKPKAQAAMMIRRSLQEYGLIPWRPGICMPVDDPPPAPPVPPREH